MALHFICSITHDYLGKISAFVDKVKCKVVDKMMGQCFLKELQLKNIKGWLNTESAPTICIV